MIRKQFSVCFLFILIGNSCDSQVLQFGTCAEVETMRYFDLERFLGVWYEIARFPTWYEKDGSCAYKYIEYCGRTVEIEHVFIRDEIQYVLHLNSSYYPGDDAVFTIQENNIDIFGIPIMVISTDYSKYALVYGCRNREDTGIKYISAWILSRERVLSDDIYQNAVEELNAIPGANAAYLETVEQREEICAYYWTAHVHAVYTETSDSSNK